MNFDRRYNMPAIIVEGHIGAGKSVLTKQLGRDLGVPILLEAVKEDGDHDGNPWLGDYYKDSPGIAFKTQMYFISQRFRNYVRMCQDNDTWIGDRSLFGDICFAKVQRDMGKLDMAEYDTYKRLFDVMINLLELPRIMIFLQADVDFLMRRVQSRGREMEAAISREYMSSLNKHYTELAQGYIGEAIYIDCEELEGRDGCVATDSAAYQKLRRICGDIVRPKARLVGAA